MHERVDVELFRGLWILRRTLGWELEGPQGRRDLSSSDGVHLVERWAWVMFAYANGYTKASQIF